MADIKLLDIWMDGWYNSKLLNVFSPHSNSSSAQKIEDGRNIFGSSYYHNPFFFKSFIYLS